MSPLRVTLRPLVDRPILPTAAQSTAAQGHLNLNGPSLIRVPDWATGALGRYYLYFADHKGQRIELAYSDALVGPWQIHEAGALQLADTPFLQQPPAVPEGIDLEQLGRPRAPGVPSPLADSTVPHIASPEVIVDEASRTIRLYYHGLDAFVRQITRVAVSPDGLSFDAQNEILAPPYLRMFAYGGMWYGLAMPGKLVRSRDGLGDFEAGPTLFEPDMRHAGLWLRGDELWVFWTRVGDAPERILLSRIDLRSDWMSWREGEACEVRRPERGWEGADWPTEPSLRSAVDHPVNQLRDPAPYLDVETGRAFVAYACAGESGIAIGELTIEGEA